MDERKVIVIPADPEQVAKQQNKGRQKVAAYCRVSTDTEEQESSYEAQVDYYTKKINLNPEWIFAGIFADEGISGRDAEHRPGFMEMIEKCKKKKIDIIYTKSISRFARNTLDNIKYVRLLKKYGVKVIFEKEGIDTSMMSDELLLTIFGAMAQAELESHSKNVQMGFRYAFKRGDYKFKRMYGYTVDKEGNVHIVPTEAEVVKRVFDEYLQGYSFQQITNGLNRDGFLTFSGKEWRACSLRDMISNEKYMGDVLLQKTYSDDCMTKKRKVNRGELPQYYIENNHPPIVSKEIYKLAQIERSRRKSKDNPLQKNRKSEMGKFSGKYALTDRIICDECGSRYRRVTWPRYDENGNKKVVWRCLNRLEFGKKYCQLSPSIHEPVLHNAILQAVRSLMSRKEYLVETLKKQLIKDFEDNNGEMTPGKLQRKLDELDEDMKVLLANMANADDTKFYERKFKAITEQKAKYRDQLEELERQKKQDEIKDYQLQKTLESINEDSINLKEYDDEMVRELIDRVYVLNAHKIRIRFKEGYQMEVAI